MAEYMLKDEATKRGLQLDVTSAGSRALNGHPIHPSSRRILVERGIDPSAFSSRLLTSSIAGQSDLVLGMTRDHRAVARQLAPIRWKRMYALQEIANSHFASVEGGTALSDPTDSRLDIDDPIGRTDAFFERVAGEIERSVVGVCEWIAAQSSAAIVQRHEAKQE